MPVKQNIDGAERRLRTDAVKLPSEEGGGSLMN